MSAHTPGPWQIDWNVSRLNIFRSEMGTLVASIRRSGISSELDVIAIANARLIAAAPELLEALERLVSLDDGDQPALWAFADVFDEARAAIAKAKGVA